MILSNFLNCKDSWHIWIFNQLFCMTISNMPLGPLHHATLKWSKSTKIEMFFSCKKSALVSEVCWTISKYYHLETSRARLQKTRVLASVSEKKKNPYKAIYLLQTLIFQICSTNAHYIQGFWVSWLNLCVWNVSVSRQLLFFFSADLRILRPYGMLVLNGHKTALSMSRGYLQRQTRYVNQELNQSKKST